MRKSISIPVVMALLMSMTACSGTDSGSSDLQGNPGLISTPADNTSTENQGNQGSNQSSSDDWHSASTPTSQTEPPNPNNGHNDGEMSGKVFVLENGMGIQLYGGGYSRGENYAKSLNEIKNRVGDKVNVFSLVAPTHGSFYLPEKYKNYMASEWDNIEYINEHLDGVIPVDAYTALSKHVDEHIYLSTDHHWAPLGAFYAAEEFAKTALTDFAPMSDYEVQSRDGYVGTFDGYSDHDKRILDNPETFTIYIPQNNYSTEHYNSDMTNGQQSYLFDNLQAVDLWNCYLVYHVDDGGITHVTTDKKNNRKLLVVKDSYANPLVPCLTNSFEEIWAVDMRTFQLSISQFVKDHGITDVLFCMCTFSATGDNQYKLEGIL